jgi:hypothetical protein
MAADALPTALYPNPAHASDTLLLPAKAARPATAELRDALSCVVRRYLLPAGSGRHELPLTGVVPGHYPLRLSTGRSQPLVVD